VSRHFNFKLIKKTTTTQALNVENTLWANTVLASGTATAIVVYTGRDTRASMNTSFPEIKVGLVDLEINRLTKILATVVFCLSITLVGLQGFKGFWYIYVLRFMILFSSIIPIRYSIDF
jgi:phospholipid-translocating ATPase